MKKKIFLLDAFALIFRAYFAFIKNPLINSKGVNTSAITGFLNTLYELIQKEKPEYLAVVFDTYAPTERHIEYKEYKANRQETPEVISFSTPVIKEILRALNIAVIEYDGYEADDVIGTLAKKAEANDYDVFMVTPDKDFGQLVDDHIFIYKPAIGKNPHEILGKKEVCAKWDIPSVDHVIDILGLMGDAVDNIPGVPGVGEKTAAKLINEYGSLEKIYENVHLLKGKQKENFETYRDQAFLSKKLATILIDAPVSFDHKQFLVEAPNLELAKPLFADLELRTLGKKFLGTDFNVVANQSSAQGDLFQETLFTSSDSSQIEFTPSYKTAENTPHEYVCVDNANSLELLLFQLGHAQEVCFDTETTSLDTIAAKLVGISFSFHSGEAFYVPIPEDAVAAQKMVENFRGFFEDENIIKIGQNIKYDILVLKKYKIKVQGPIWDTMLAHYLIEPDLRHGMDYLSETYLSYQPISIETLIGKKGKNQLSMRDVPLDKITEYAAEDADITLQLKHFFAPQIIEKKVEKLFHEVEAPLVYVLADMEATGVKIDADFLNKYSQETGDQLDIIRKQIYELAGTQFNLDSPKQLGQVLFELMQLPYQGKKTKTGQYSTDEEVLSALVEEHDIAKELLNYRELTKLKSTYIDALPNLISPITQRLHTSFNQAVAATGRLSSNNPNLQNIPIRTDRGKEIRKAFIPRDENHTIISADYSQIELRIMAALSGDHNMCQAFIDDHDIHTATAAKVYNVAIADVDSTMRRNAKMVNFGIIYGISAFGLSQRLGVSRSEAKALIDGYFELYPGVKRYMDDSISKARNQGFAETILGRKRTLKDIHSSNFTVRGFAERNAINTPIQGSAADMIKVAMLRIHDIFNRENFKSKLTLQVHDELVFDAHKDEVEIIKPIIIDCMKNAIPLSVPIEVGIGSGENWLVAH